MNSVEDVKRLKPTEGLESKLNPGLISTRLAGAERSHDFLGYSEVVPFLRHDTI